MTTLIASLIASLIAAQCLWVRGQASATLMTTLIASLIASLIAAQCLWVRGQASRHRGDGGGDRGGARELEVARAAPGAARQVRPCLKKGRRPPCVPPPPTPCGVYQMGIATAHLGCGVCWSVWSVVQSVGATLSLRVRLVEFSFEKNSSFRRL